MTKKPFILLVACIFLFALSVGASASILIKANIGYTFMKVPGIISDPVFIIPSHHIYGELKALYEVYPNLYVGIKPSLSYGTGEGGSSDPGNSVPDKTLLSALTFGIAADVEYLHKLLGNFYIGGGINAGYSQINLRILVHDLEGEVLVEKFNDDAYRPFISLGVFASFGWNVNSRVSLDMTAGYNFGFAIKDWTNIGEPDFEHTFVNSEKSYNAFYVILGANFKF